MNILIACGVILIILQVYILKLKWNIYSTWLNGGRMASAERLYKAVIGFSPNRLLYLSNEDEPTKYEIIMDALCAHLGTETYYQDGVPNFKVTLRRILWNMRIKHVLNWKSFPKRSAIATILFCLPLLVSAQDINVSAYFGGTTVSQQDPNNYDLETGLIMGLSGMVAWSTLYVEASVLRESHDFNTISSFKGHGIEISAGWTTKEPPNWKFFIGPYYRIAWDTGLRMHNYGIQTQIQYGPIFGKGQIGFYDYGPLYVGYSGIAVLGIRLTL